MTKKNNNCVHVRAYKRCKSLNHGNSSRLRLRRKCRTISKSEYNKLRSIQAQQHTGTIYVKSYTRHK